MLTLQESSTSASTHCPPSPNEQIVARPAEFEDWEGIKAVTERLSSSRFSAFLSCSTADAQSWLLNSLMWPQQIGLLIVKWYDTICGVAAVMAMDVPNPSIRGVDKGQRHGFMHSVYIDPWIPNYTCRAYGKMRVPSAAGSVLCKEIERWSKERGCNFLYANMRLQGHFTGLLKKYGFERQHIVVGKALGGNNG